MTSLLHEERLDAVHDVVVACGARTVLDLGCGEGDLVVRLLAEPRIERVVGLDLSLGALERLRARLRACSVGTERRVELVHGSMTTGAHALVGFDCAVLLETLEHLDPRRLSILERSVFAVMAPATVVVTTPNADFNPLLGLRPGALRHPEHRFEWGRARFRAWAQGVAGRHGYAVRFLDLGPADPEHGAPTQLALYEMRDRRGQH